MAILASQKVSFCGSFPAEVELANIACPPCGWDTAVASWMFCDDDGDIDVQLVANNFVKCAPYTDQMNATGSLMYIHQIFRQRVPGGWIITLNLRGYNDTFGASGCAKFMRLPYESELELQTAGGKGTQITLTQLQDTVGGSAPYAVVGDSCVRFTKPRVKWVDCYLANGDCFDPYFEQIVAGQAPSNLDAVGAATNWFTDTDFSSTSNLTDWVTALRDDVPIMQQFGEFWPEVSIQSAFAPGSPELLCLTFNSGFVLTSRRAERVCQDPTVDLWSIFDAFALYQYTELG